MVILAVALATISAFAFAYAGTNTTTVNYPNSTNGYYHNGMMGDWSGMMGSMMNGNWGPSSTVQTPAIQSAVFPLVGFAAVIGAVLTGTGGIIYYITGPRIRTTATTSEAIVVEQMPRNTVTPYESVSKTLTTEERKVLDVLALHNGKYLQKYIRAETGLSRLKTHRIVSRLAERGIVTLERTGNTNEVHISSWLQNQPFQNTINDKLSKNQEIVVQA